MSEQSAKNPVQMRVRTLLLILGVVLVASNLRASITAVGPLIGQIVTETGISNTLAGMLTALPLLSFAALSLLAPKIARHLGMEYTLFASLFVLTAGIFIRWFPSVVALFIGTGVLGLAIAMGNVLLPSLIKREFPQRIGLLTGGYSVAMNGWAAIASGVSVPLAKGLNLGWRNALLCWSILSICAIVAWLPQLRVRHQDAKSAGSSHYFLLRSSLAWQVTLFMGLQSTGFYATVAWIPAILHDRGISVTAAGWMLSLMQFVSLPVTFIVPVLAGRMTNQRGIVIAISVLFLGGYACLLIGGTMLVTLAIILIGLGQGASISLALTFFGLRTSNARQAAELSGMAQSLGYLLAAVGPVLFGFLHDRTHSWTGTIMALIVASVLQLIVGLGAGRNEVLISHPSEEMKCSSQRDIPLN
jgi:MFS transporter, CP family, cyanate transporter